jgi:LysM repeat protein
VRRESGTTSPCRRAVITGLLEGRPAWSIDTCPVGTRDLASVRLLSRSCVWYSLPAEGRPVATVATPIATATPDVPATYVVKSGDTGLEIAARFGITLEALAQANNVTTVQLNSLQIGQQLRIPR